MSGRVRSHEGCREVSGEKSLCLSRDVLSSVPPSVIRYNSPSMDEEEAGGGGSGGGGMGGKNGEGEEG